MKSWAFSFMVLLQALSLHAQANESFKTLVCRSPKGQEPRLYYQSIEDSQNQDWMSEAFLKIDGVRAEVSDRVESNDAYATIAVQLNKGLVSAESTLTSDDGDGMSASLQSSEGTFELASGSVEQKGSAKFQALFSGSLSQGKKTKSVQNALVNCTIRWSEKAE